MRCGLVLARTLHFDGTKVGSSGGGDRMGNNLLHQKEINSFIQPSDPLGENCKHKTVGAERGRERGRQVMSEVTKTNICECSHRLITIIVSMNERQ